MRGILDSTHGSLWLSTLDKKMPLHIHMCYIVMIHYFVAAFLIYWHAKKKKDRKEMLLNLHFQHLLNNHPSVARSLDSLLKKDHTDAKISLDYVQNLI